MSDLTPNEIADYPLRTGVRGYRVEQVDELLDRVADRIEALERELASTRQRLEDAEGRAQEASATEATLKRTLVTAQRAAEETVAEARTEAATLRSEAEEQADQLLSSARAEADELRAQAADRLRDADEQAERVRRDAEDDVRRLRQVAEQFRSRLREHLDAHAALLDGAPSAHELDTVVPAPEAPGAVSREPDSGPMQGSALFGANLPDESTGDFSG